MDQLPPPTITTTSNSLVNQHAESIFSNAQFQVLIPNNTTQIDCQSNIQSIKYQQDTAIFDQIINVYLIATIDITSPTSEDSGHLLVLEQFAASLDISVQVSVGELIDTRPQQISTNQLDYRKHFFHQSTVTYNRREPGCAPVINTDQGWVAFRILIPIAYVDSPPTNKEIPIPKIPISMLFTISQQMLTVATTPSTYPIDLDDTNSDLFVNTQDANNLLAGLNEIDPVFRTARLSISKPRSVGTPTLVNDPVHIPAPRRVLDHTMFAVRAIDLSAATLPQRLRDDAVLVCVHLENVLPIIEWTQVTILSMSTQCLMHKDDVPVDLYPVCQVPFPIQMGHGDRFDCVYSYILPVVLNSVQFVKTLASKPATDPVRYTQHPSETLHLRISLVYSVGTNVVSSDMQQQVMAAKFECALTNPLPLFRPLNTDLYPFTAPPLPIRARSPSPTRASLITSNPTSNPVSPNKHDRLNDLKSASGQAKRLSMTDEAILTMTRTFSQLRKSVMTPNLPARSATAQDHKSPVVHQDSRRASVDVIPTIKEIKQGNGRLVDKSPEQISGVDLKQITSGLSETSLLDIIPPHQLTSNEGGVLIVTLSIVHEAASPCIKVGDEFMLDVQLINHMSKSCAYTIEVPQLVTQLTNKDTLPSPTSSVPVLLDPLQFAVASANMDATLPAIICLEQYVRVRPIHPKQVASIRVRYQALRPGVHSIGTIDLVDMINVNEKGVHPKIAILDSLSVLVH